MKKKSFIDDLIQQNTKEGKEHGQTGGEKKSFIDLLKKFYGRRQNKHFQYQSKAETEKEIIAFKKTWNKGDKTTLCRSIQGGEIFPWHNFTR